MKRPAKPAGERAGPVSEAQFRALMEQAPVAISVSREGVGVYANQAWTRLFRLNSPQAAVGRAIIEYLAPECREASRKRTRRRQAGLPVPLEFETTGLRTDGTPFPMHVAVAPVQLEDGYANVAFVTDISERTLAVEQLRQREAFYRSLFENISDCLFIIDVTPDQRFKLVSFNPAEERAVGLTTAQVAGKFTDDVLPGAVAEQVNRNYRRCVEQGGIIRYEEELALPRGRVPFLTTLIPLAGPDGRIHRIIGVATDITERKRAEEALRESADRLQRLSRQLLAVQEEERRHLSRELHDEFGQLLATITVQLHAARRVAGEGAQSRLEACAALLKQLGAALHGLALDLRPTMLETAGLDATLRWLGEQQHQRTGIPVEVVGHLDVVPADIAIACFRVVQEALTNVVRHAQAQHVWIELRRSASLVDLVVRDDGVGFDVDPTVEQAARRGHLGLIGMRERVDALGGRVEVQSRPGAGTRIRIAVPLAEVTAQPTAPAV
jgi:PAS domain S-box-containing protein